MRQVDPVGLAKAILWEEAKGKLRALIAADGSVPSTAPSKWEEMTKKIDKFIKAFEDEGLHE